MDISEVLSVNNICSEMMATTKQQAIEELTNMLVRDGAIINKDEFIRDVWLREAQGSTGFENHIAIPHGKSSGVARTALAIGRTRQQIPWETMDGSDVRCIILFAVRPEDQNTAHIRLLAQVSASLADEEIISRLLKETEPKKLFSYLILKINSITADVIRQRVSPVMQ